MHKPTSLHMFLRIYRIDAAACVPAVVCRAFKSCAIPWKLRRVDASGPILPVNAQV
jgi:hypothetical protein